MNSPCLLLKAHSRLVQMEQPTASPFQPFGRIYNDECAIALARRFSGCLVRHNLTLGAEPVL
jgi:hypothetical protein